MLLNSKLTNHSVFKRTGNYMLNFVNTMFVTGSKIVDKFGSACSKNSLRLPNNYSAHKIQYMCINAVILLFLLALLVITSTIQRLNNFGLAYFRIMNNNTVKTSIINAT